MSAKYQVKTAYEVEGVTAVLRYLKEVLRETGALWPDDDDVQAEVAREILILEKAAAEIDKSPFGV